MYTTGTPYKEVKVSADGYETATVDVTLTPVPAPTKSPMGLAVLGLIGAVGAVVLLRRD